MAPLTAVHFPDRGLDPDVVLVKSIEKRPIFGYPPPRQKEKGQKMGVFLARTAAVLSVVFGAGLFLKSAKLVADDTPTTYFWAYTGFTLSALSMVLGLYLLRAGVRGFQVFLTIVFGVALSLACVEGMLATGWFDQIHSPRPIWRSPRLVEMASALDVPNRILAQDNTFGFTDENHSLRKIGPRVAFLGDSFVWGAGLPPGQSWNQKTAALIKSVRPDIEILHWGVNKWSTQDEYTFLEKRGFALQPDLIIVGVVSNDPDVDRFPQLFLNLKGKPVVRWIRKVLPNTVTLISDALEYYHSLFNSNYGYFNWNMNLYSEDNLVSYGLLLESLSKACAIRNIRILAVFTPDNADPIFRERFDKLIPLFSRAQIPFLDTYPAIHEKFKDVNPRTLWANPGDGHPGSDVTDVMASEVFQYLITKDLLPDESRP